MLNVMVRGKMKEKDERMKDRSLKRNEERGKKVK